MCLGLATGYQRNEEKTTTSLLKPYTNFDKLKESSIDEAATLLANTCAFCPHKDSCTDTDCETAMKEWLESEAIPTLPRLAQGGRWVARKGPVYPMFNLVRHTRKDTQNAVFEKYFLSCDYGTINPFSLGLWGYNGQGKTPEAVRLKEFYYDSRKHGRQLTDEEYYTELKKLAYPYSIEAITIEASAASFIETISRHGEFCVIKADNDVLAGIDAVCNALENNRIYIDSSCTDTLREFLQYCWDSETKRNAPKRENDHAMDDIRFFVKTILTDEEFKK